MNCVNKPLFVWLCLSWSSGRMLEEDEKRGVEVLTLLALSLSGAERPPPFCVPQLIAYCSSQSYWLFLSLCSLVGAPSPHLFGPASGIVWLLLSWHSFEERIQSLRETVKLKWSYYVQPAQPSLVIPASVDQRIFPSPVKKCLHEEAPASLKGSVVTVHWGRKWPCSIMQWNWVPDFDGKNRILA